MQRLGTTTAALAIIGATLLSGCGGTQERTQGRDGDDTPVRATPGALVAVALDHLDYREKDLSSVKSANIKYGFGPRTIGAAINFRGPDALTITVGPSEPVPTCAVSDRCVQDKDASGTTQIRWDLEEPEEDPGYVAVTRYTDDDVRRVELTGAKITRDPRTTDLPRVGSVEGMRAIVEDPEFAWTTTQAALNDAEKLDSWPGSTEPAADPGPLKPWTPRMLGNLAYYRLWYLDRVSEATAPEPAGPTGKATGIRFNGSRIGAAASMYLLPDAPDGATTCPDGFTCTTEGPVTYAWTPGRAAIFRERSGFVLRIYYVDNQLDAPGRANFESGDLEQLVKFSDDPAIGARMSTDWADVLRTSWEDS